MRMESRRASAALLLLALAGLRAGIAGAESGDGSISSSAISSALPKEAAPSLFKATLGGGPDSDAELFVSGSWSASIIASLSLSAASGSSLAVSTAQPFLFTQAPNVSLSFLLFKKIFVEAQVSEDATEARYAAGYRGGKDELLKEFRVGNQGISFPSLPFLSFGEGSYRSFGALATVATDDFTGKAMVRYDQATRVEKKFVGSTEITDTEISPNAFMSGKFFMTYAKSAANLIVYVQSASGSLGGSDGKVYRQLASTEYSYSQATGFVTLTSAASTRVLAHYDNALVGFKEAVTVSGNVCDLLYDPPSDEHTSAIMDPKLQVLNRYATTASSSTAEAFVLNAASGKRDSSFEVTIDSAGYAEVTQGDMSASSASSTAEREAYRQPFASSSYGGMDWLYTTDFDCDTKTGSSPVYTRKIVVRSFASTQGISLGKDVVAGSIEVTRDGVPDYGFTFDSDTGILKLAVAAGASEEIVVSYMTESSDRRSGIIVGALGGFWDLGESRNAWAALGASWSLPGTSYASDSSTNPGSVNLTAGEKDADGPFKHEAAIAARYSRDDATGLYRIEGMESSGDYDTSFRFSSDTAPYTAVETTESDLSDIFSSTMDSLHSSSTTQQALKISATSSATSSDTAILYKVESTPVYDSYTTFSFFAKIPSGVTLTLTMDDDAASPTKSLEVTINQQASSSAGQWKRYFLRYGKGETTVYSQTKEDGSESIAGSASVVPGATSTGSRLVLTAVGLTSSYPVWIDEILLEDSVGRVAALFQGKLSYVDSKLRLGSDKFPVFSGISLSADSQASLADSTYASFGSSISTDLLFVDLGLKGHVLMKDDAATSFRGGHSIALPSFDFPLKLKDEFELDPSTGAFGRSDTFSLTGGGLASLSLAQASTWTPASTILDEGMLLQTWSGSLVLGPSFATLGLTAKNRSWPGGTVAPGGSGADYGAAWLGAFEYALPALESYSDLREAAATLSMKMKGKEFLGSTLGESTEPEASGGSIRRDSASLRMAVPFSLAGLSLEPYYARAWKDKRGSDSGSIYGDADDALADLSSLPLIYGGIPFAEFFRSKTASDFTSQTMASATVPLDEARFAPETGIGLAREYGSNWYDLVAPSALALSYKRILARSSDTVTDSGQWDTTAKFAAINVFGSLGAHPLGLFFDSDEYLGTLQAEYTLPRDGSASSLDLQCRSLATLYAGDSDKLDIDSKLSIDNEPDSLSWSYALSLSLSRLVPRHWLLDLYSLAMQAGAKKDELAPDSEDQAGKKGKLSIASLYLQELATKIPKLRSTVTLKGSLSGVQSDAEAYSPGWSLTEIYEAKLTVPERLTIKVDSELDQSRDASTKVFTLGLTLTLNAVISF
jgi:hypothetical protein